MIEASHALTVIAASRKGESALVITSSPHMITQTRHYLEDHGAAMQHVRFCTPDSLHQARGCRFDVVVVDSYARMRAMERLRSDELEHFIKSVTA
jgi:4-hydroxyphenylpyruvate dioxygenase-like putative hemolysin